MVNDCFSVAAICLCAVVLALLLKRHCAEQSLFVSLAACVMLLSLFAVNASEILDELHILLAESQIDTQYISAAFKAAAICILTQITADLCRDSGESAIASAAELWGRGAITLIAMPIITSLISTVKEYLL